MAAPTTMAELYVEELKDLYSAENQILKALPKMIKAATNGDLKTAFQTHLQQTETHVQRLETILKALDESPKGKMCHGMQGVIEEGAELIGEAPPAPILDVGLISAAQHVEHYEIAGYGSVREWADQLGHADQAKALQQTLDEEIKTDKLLTQLAQSLNPDAERKTADTKHKPELADKSPSSTKPAGSTSKAPAATNAARR
jgi:ferritin-like metal-binding protein YciE